MLQPCAPVLGMMSRRIRKRCTSCLTVAVLAGFTAIAHPQAKPDANSAPGGGPVQQQTPQSNPTTPLQSSVKGPETHLTGTQARELFRSVDEILHFASDDSKLPIRHEVKRKLQTRESVEKYVVDKFNDDEDAKRMQRSEIVLKKFGLLDRDFQLKPFLVSLLTEQIAGYYDSKTKTVNLLDWIAPDSQKPVLAHELTHALQDQHVDLDKWESRTLTDISKNVADDNRHLEGDEDDTAREAVLEGQAMAVFMDYSLKSSGRKLVDSPDLTEEMKRSLQDNSDSPVMARAPLLLQESLLFPYREGLSFEQAVMKDKGIPAAFEGVLDRPPATSYEIMNPRAYERKKQVPLLKMPDVHELLDSQYEPYDIGVMGALDVRILTELFGGEEASTALTPQWDGGLYYAARSRSAKTDQKAGTGSIALVYFSAWRSPEAAKTFGAIYAEELGKKYSGVSRNETEESVGEQVYKTNEGPVLIATNGRQVFVSESFDLTLARKLELLLTGAQGGEDMQTAQGTSWRRLNQRKDLTGGLVNLFASCGMMRAGLVH